MKEYMTDVELIQFAKSQIASGKGFAETETELILNYGKGFGDAHKLVGIAKAELGMAEDATEEDIKIAKSAELGSRINIISWIVFIISIIMIFVESKPVVWGERFFLISFILAGVAIFLRQRIKISFFYLDGVIAKLVSGLAFISALIGLIQTF